MSSSNSKLSSKLKQLRFMQRAAKKQEQEEVAAEEQAATKSVSLGDGLGLSQVRCCFIFGRWHE
jgi:alkaline phosphatase